MKEVSPLNNIAIGFGMGCIASCAAVTFTNPLEVIKTRLQMDNARVGLRGNAIKQTLAGTAKSIVTQEGLGALQRGLVAAYFYQSIMNGTRLGIYDPVRTFIYQKFNQPIQKSKISLNALAGFLSGSMCAFASSPFLLIKTRLQTNKSAPQSTLQVLKSIYSAAGLKGLFHGVSASMVRTGVGSMSQLASYDFCKGSLMNVGFQDDVKTHFVASTLTGGFIATFMCPFDTITTRYYNQKSGDVQVYKSAVDCARKTIAEEGLLSLWKGWVPLFLRVGPHTIITFLVLEQLKRAYKTWQEE
jgi:solute carrier family 25 protein 34/35